MKHHAVCYVGVSLAHTELEQYLSVSHPDIHRMVFDELGIGHARELASRASQTPLQAAQHTFIIECERLTHEAQNALLKLFEEPPPRTQFYLRIPRRGLLLPTLQSRLHIVEELSTLNKTSKDDIYASFKAASYGDRLELIARVCKENDGSAIEAIVSGCESEARSAKAPAGLLGAVLTTRDHISRKGASKKMLLESLALYVPSK